MKRHTFTIIILLSIIFLPYWVYLPLLLLAIVMLPMFWEGILLGLLTDMLYGSMTAVSYPVVGIIVTALVIISIPLRARLRNYV